MSQDLFQEIKRKLYGNGGSNGVFIRNEEANTPLTSVVPEKVTRINQTKNETGFTWKSVSTTRKPYKNEGSSFLARAKYPARLGISDPSDEKGFTWKPVTSTRKPYENESSSSKARPYEKEGSTFLARAKYPARLGISDPSDEKGFTWKPVTSTRKPYENESSFSSARPYEKESRSFLARAKYPARLGISDLSDEKDFTWKQVTTIRKPCENETSSSSARPYEKEGNSFLARAKDPARLGISESSDEEGTKRRKVNRDRNNNALNKIFYALPETYCLPGKTTRHPMESKRELKRRYNEAMGLPSHIEPQSLTMEERSKGYIKETRIGQSNGAHDKFYYHIETSLRFRSLKAVKEYILYGKVPGESSLNRYQQDQGEKKLKPRIIGILDFKTKIVGPPEEEINFATNDGGLELVEVEPLSEQIEDREEGVAGSSSTTNRTTYTLRKGFYMDFEFVPQD